MPTDTRHHARNTRNALQHQDPAQPLLIREDVAAITQLLDSQRLRGVLGDRLVAVEGYQVEALAVGRGWLGGSAGPRSEPVGIDVPTESDQTARNLVTERLCFPADDLNGLEFLVRRRVGMVSFCWAWPMAFPQPRYGQRGRETASYRVSPYMSRPPVGQVR
jgi:hypothetical protein